MLNQKQQFSENKLTNHLELYQFNGEFALLLKFIRLSIFEFRLLLLLQNHNFLLFYTITKNSTIKIMIAKYFDKVHNK